MPSKVSKTKLKMRMTRTTSANKLESSSQPPAKTIKTSVDSYHYQAQHRQRSREDSAASADSHSKVSNVPSLKSDASIKGTKNPANSYNSSHPSKLHHSQKNTVVQKEPHPDDKSSQSSGSSDEKHCELDGPIHKRYNIKTRLGKGAYGIVWEAYEKSTGDKVALKKIFDAFRNDTDAQRTYREIMFLREFGNHQNIIRLLNVHRAVNNMDIYLVFPFMEHDLHRLIKESPEVLKDNHIRIIFYQTLKAVKYLHSGDVIHRDLKPANILIDDHLNVKVADFGLARSLSSPDDIMSETNPVMTDYVATRWYRPPEILLSCPYYTKGVDMWSLGCILGEMILKVPLFPGGSTVHQVETIMSHIAPPTPQEIEEMCGQHVQTTMIETAMVYRKKSIAEVFEQCDSETVDLLEKFLVFNPAKRITAEETLAHPYLARYRRQAEEIVRSHPVSPPLNDYVQLPMCQYRSVIYDLIQVRKIRQHQSSQSQHNSTSQLKLQYQQHPHVFTHPKAVDSPTTTPISKSQPSTVVPATVVTTQTNVNETRKTRATNNNGSNSMNAIGVKTKPHLRTENEKDGRKSYPVKTVQTLSREVATSSSCDHSPRTIKPEARSTTLENDGNGSQKSRHHGSNSLGATVNTDSTLDRGIVKQPTRKNNSTPNIPQVRKIPGPDGDGHDLPLPYLKLVSTAPGFQGKNPRLFDRSELSARTTYPVPNDLRGADKKLFEFFSNTDDLEEEIKAIEFQVRAKRASNPAQAQWIADLSNNLNKATVSDPPSNFPVSAQNQVIGESTRYVRSSSTVKGDLQVELEIVGREAKVGVQYQGSNVKVPGRSVQQTRLPEILQSWNQGPAKILNSSVESATKQGRRSTYFQDPAPSSVTSSCSATKSTSAAVNHRTVGMPRISQLSPKEYSLQQRQVPYQHPNTHHSQNPRSTTPIEIIQARNKHYESYSQTHGTISASDLTELKANIGFISKS